MTLPAFEKRYGPPDYGPRKGTVGLVVHTFEGNHTLTVEEARKGAAWQASPSNTSGGSYNVIMGPGFILETVPWGNASGGMHPATAQRDAEPWVRELMGPQAMGDPNAYVIQVCLWGRTGEFLRQGYPDALIQQGAELVIKAERDYGIDCVVSGHMHWQNDRSDPGQPYIDAVLERYTQLVAPPRAAIRMRTRYVGPLVTLKADIPAEGAYSILDRGVNERPRFSGRRHPALTPRSRHSVSDLADLTFDDGKTAPCYRISDGPAKGLWVDSRFFMEPAPVVRASQYPQQ